jgi:protein-S-isoprenylcysteine O-methyltransferase Ste14
MTRFEIVDDAKQAWRWISMQAMTAALAVQGAWAMLPADMRASVPPDYVQWITFALLGLGIVGRLVKQEPK